MSMTFGIYFKYHDSGVGDRGSEGEKHAPKSFDLSKIRAKSLKIRTKSHKDIFWRSSKK